LVDRITFGAVEMSHICQKRVKFWWEIKPEEEEDVVHPPKSSLRHFGS